MFVFKTDFFEVFSWACQQFVLTMEKDVKVQTQFGESEFLIGGV